jgi:type IV pilus assembly protein PilM
VVDVDAVSAGLRDLFAREKLPKRVRLAIASQGVAFRIVRLPRIEDPDQLKAAVRFQAQEQIPMPLESAVLDHQVIGAQIDDDGTRHLDVAVVAARRQTVDALLQAARGAGLEPAGIDLAAFGMIRALAGGSARPVGEPGLGAPEGEAFVSATLYCSLGGVTNLAIARDFACLFSRVAQFGVRDIATELAEGTGLKLEDAERWLVHAGLAAPLEDIEGDPATAAAARAALEVNLGRLADELRLSLDYYGGQEGAAPVSEVVLCGWGSAIPGLAEGLGAHLGREVSVRRPDALLAMSAADAARLTLPYGLALEH